VTHIYLVAMIPTIKKVSVNKNHKGKTLHLIVEVQDGFNKKAYRHMCSMLVDALPSHGLNPLEGSTM